MGTSLQIPRAEPWKALVLGLLGGAVLVLIQQRVHRRCRPCQQRWARIKQRLGLRGESQEGTSGAAETSR